MRSAAFFGRVTADPRRWALSPGSPAQARMVIAGHTVETDTGTQRLGYCSAESSAFDPTACAAYVGMRTPGVAAWVLLASRPRARIASQPGRLEVLGTTVWKVDGNSLVLSEGVRLPLGTAFARKLEASGSSAHSARSRLESDSVGATIWIDPHTGEVLDAGANGCA